MSCILAKSSPRKRTILSATAVVALFAVAGPASAATVSDPTLSVDFNSTGTIVAVTLNGVLVDFGSQFIRGSCSGFAGGSVPVVTGTTATYTATCGSFSVQAAIRLLSPLPSLPAASGGFEMEYTFTNGTGGTLPLTAIADCDSDLMLTIGDDVAGYDASSNAVYNIDTVVDPDTLMAVVAATDQPGATYGWDVGALGTASTSFPMDNAVGPVGPTDTQVTIGSFANVAAGDSATVRFRSMYARGVTTVPADFDFSSCYSSPPTACVSGLKSLLLLKDKVDSAKDKLIWKLSGAGATLQTEFADPTADGDYSLCVYENGSHLAGAHIAASASKWAPLSSKGYKYADAGATSSGIGKVLLKGSDQDKTKILVKGSGANLPDPSLGALITPISVRLHNGDNPGSCWEADFGTTLKNDIGQLKAKTP